MYYPEFLLLPLCLSYSPQAKKHNPTKNVNVLKLIIVSATGTPPMNSTINLNPIKMTEMAISDIPMFLFSK